VPAVWVPWLKGPAAEAHPHAVTVREVGAVRGSGVVAALQAWPVEDALAGEVRQVGPVDVGHQVRVEEVKAGVQHGHGDALALDALVPGLGSVDRVVAPLAVKVEVVVAAGRRVAHVFLGDPLGAGEEGRGSVLDHVSVFFVDRGLVGLDHRKAGVGEESLEGVAVFGHHRLKVVGDFLTNTR